MRQGNSETACENAHVQLLFDQEIYSPKILVTDNDTGEILADMLIHTETEFQVKYSSIISTNCNAVLNSSFLTKWVESIGDATAAGYV